MATITSTASGLASAGGTWVGGVAPVTGDIVVIANGHVVHWDTALTTAGAGVLLGSNAGAAGDAVAINGASSVSFGTLIVDDGATLWLRGIGTSSNRLMINNRYGKFEPAPGATIVGDVAGDFTSIIDNRGQLTAIGTAPKPITFTSPAANYAWNNSIVAETFPNLASTSWPYDHTRNIACGSLSKQWIANAANTGKGVLGDTSLTFASQSPASILATEVASLDLVNGVGKYFVDYDAGFVFFYHVNSAGNPSATATYKYLTSVKGWGITASTGTTHASALFDYCAFSYMGPSTSVDNRCLDIQFKLTAAANAGATDRLFYLKNSTVNFCKIFLGLKSCTGTAADRLLITGNTFNNISGSSSTVGCAITTYRSSSTYVKIDGNAFNQRTAFILSAAFSTVVTNTGWLISNNTGRAVSFMIGQIGATVWPNTIVEDNTIGGFGWGLDSRLISSCGGTSGNPMLIQDNTFEFGQRAIHFAPYLTIQRNIIKASYHHCIVGPTEDDFWLSTIVIQNNLAFTAADTTGATQYGSPFLEIGYNHRHWIDGFICSNNTVIDNGKGLVGWGDCQDGTGIVTTMTGVEVTNNLITMQVAGTNAFKRQVDGSSLVTRLAGVIEFDYNLDYNFTTRYTATGLPPKQGTFTLGSLIYNRLTVADRNVPGVSLCGPSYSGNVTGKSLVLTVNSADADVTLAWAGGTAVQLIFATNGTGTATSGAIVGSLGIATIGPGSLTVSGAAWSTTKSNAACPAGHWLKITGGTGVGQVGIITNNTATVLTVAPVWTVVPDATSTYAIYKSEVTLTDVNAVDTVIAGVDLRSLPTTTKTDTGIAVTVTSNITASDPLLVNVAGTTAPDFKFTASSPAKNAGQNINAPATDYFGTGRPQGSAFDIGFFELLSTGGVGLIGEGLVGAGVLVSTGGLFK